LLQVCVTSVTVVIEPSDDAFGVVSFVADALVNVTAEEGTTARLPLVRNGGLFGEVRILWEVRPVSPLLNASEQVDFASGFVTFQPNEFSTSVEVSITDDPFTEDTQHITVHLIAAEGGARVGPNNSTVITIPLNDKVGDCQPQFCQNGGTCTPGLFGHACKCRLGFIGDDCETNVNECANVTCLNGGTCEDGVNEFTCNCVGDYTGLVCEMRPLCAPGTVWCLRRQRCVPETVIQEQCRAPCKEGYAFCLVTRQCVPGSTQDMPCPIEGPAPAISAATTVNVSELVGVGFEVATVSATARHKWGLNITYHIAAGNTNDKFAIGATSGRITVAVPLDRETVSSYQLVVRATDRGSPPKFNETMVTVHVEDGNDHAPVFIGTPYSTSIRESAQAS